MIRRAFAIVVPAWAAALLSLAIGAQNAAGQPETVLVTLHARPGSEASLERVLQRHWSAARALNLVRAAPHVRLRFAEEGKVGFIEIFTWCDARIPDAAPAGIRALWDQMNGLVEPRGGKPGLGFTVVSVLASETEAPH